MGKISLQLVAQQNMLNCELQPDVALFPTLHATNNSNVARKRNMTICLLQHENFFACGVGIMRNILHVVQNVACVTHVTDNKLNLQGSWFKKFCLIQCISHKQSINQIIDEEISTHSKKNHVTKLKRIMKG